MSTQQKSQTNPYPRGGNFIIQQEVVDEGHHYTQQEIEEAIRFVQDCFEKYAMHESKLYFDSDLEYNKTLFDAAAALLELVTNSDERDVGDACTPN